jgi:hypothetical protein
VQAPAGWWRHRLAPWTSHGLPGRSPTARADAARAHELAARRAEADRRAPTGPPADPGTVARHVQDLRQQLAELRRLARGAAWTRGSV